MNFLAILADAYNPSLLVITLLVCIRDWRRGVRVTSLEFLLMAIIAYVWMFADKATGAFPSVGLDYSTHTATAVAMLLVAGTRVTMTGGALLFVSFLAYAGLMKLLSYHTFADVLATATLILASYAALKGALRMTSLSRRGK